MNLTRITSDKMISSEETTTEFVAALPTPCAPSFVVYPKKHDVVPIRKPKTAVLNVGGIKFDQSSWANARVR
jgi:hypothetical protein